MLYPLFVTGEVSPLEKLFHGDVHTHSPISTKSYILKSNFNAIAKDINDKYVCTRVNHSQLQSNKMTVCPSQGESIISTEL